MRTIAPGILPVATSFLKNSVTRASLSGLKCAPAGMSKEPSDAKSSAATGDTADNINSAPSDNARRQFPENINPSPAMRESVAKAQVRTRPLKARHCRFMKPGAIRGEAAEDDLGQRWRRWQRLRHRIDGDAGRTVRREAIHAGGDRGKGDR